MLFNLESDLFFSIKFLIEISEMDSSLLTSNRIKIEWFITMIKDEVFSGIE